MPLTASLIACTVSALLLGNGVAEPVTPTWAEATRRVRSDPPPEQITRGLHYVISDEARHDLFHEAVADKGGVFLGVGTNQNYLMAAWAKPEYLVIVDFDQVVVDLHQIYRALFLECETPAEFLRLWGPKWATRKVVYQHIRKHVPRRSVRKGVREVFYQYRRRVNYGLNTSLQRTQERGVPSFLDDQAQYDFIRQLYSEDRVLVRRGDFTGRKTMADIGRMLEKLELTVRVVYLSNVEQYVRWHHGRYRRNLLGLPVDEGSVVLRAYGWGSVRVADHNYRYYVQPAEMFHTWLANRKLASYMRLLRSEQPTEIVGFYDLTLSPEEYVATLPKKKKKKRRGSRDKAAAPVTAPASEARQDLAVRSVEAPHGS